MEGSLILANWPFSPFATALAAGALFAFCLTLLKRQKPPKRRHSAPARLEDLSRDPEGASNLYRTASEGFLNRTDTGTAFRRLTSSPSISNFPAFDGRVTVPSPFHLSRFPFPERPFSFSDDLINIEKQFHKLYDFPLGRHSRGKRRGYSSLPNFGIVAGLGNPPFPGFIPISRHLSPFRSSGSLARRWKSISFEPDRRRSPSPHLRTPEKRKFAFYSDSLLLPGTLSFRKKCYSTAFEFSRFRATFCASIHGVCSRGRIDSPEPRSNLLFVPSVSVRKSKSIPTELSRLDEVCDTNGTGNVSTNERGTSDLSSSVNVNSNLKDTEERYQFSVLLREVNTSPYDLSSDLDAEKSLDMIESGDESSFSQTERIDSSQSSKSKANKRLDLDDEDSLDATEKSESSFIGSSELESVILKDEAYETVESESLDKPLWNEPEHKVLCGPGSVPSTATNGALSKVDSASLANKTGVNASGLRERKTTGGAQLEKMESSKDELAAVNKVTAEGKFFSPTKDASAEYNKEEDASEYESLKSDREGKTLEDNSTTDSYYSILEKSENLLRKDSTEDEIDSSADFLTPISESANHKVLCESLEESLEEEFLSDEKSFEVRSNEKRDCVLFQNEEIGDEVENSLERTRLKSLGSEETLVSDEEMVRRRADGKEVSSKGVKKKEITPKKGAIRCLRKDEKVTIQEFSIYENGNQVLYEENNVALKISSNSFGGKGARQKTPKSAGKTTEERSISAEEKMKSRSFGGDTEQAPVVCEGVVSIGPGFVDLSVRRPTIEGRLARFQGGDNAKREPIERRDVTRPPRAESVQMERALAPERTRLTSDVRVGDNLRVVSDVWTEDRGDVTVVVQDVWRDWREDDSFDVLTADFHPVSTPERADEFRPTFEEFMPEEGGGGLNAAIQELETLSGADSPRRVNRLLGLLKRDDERRKRPPPGDEDGEWDRILGDLLRSVSELESARRRLDCSAAAGAEASAPAPAAHSAMDGAGETPTKVKSLRFKLDPDVFDVPSDDSFYEEEWKSDEPVRLVSVHASVVPAGQKSVARPVGIDLRVRLTDSSKRSHGGTTPPAQAKRRSPVADPRSLGWCQELSPVTENVDWRETFTPVTPHREVPKTSEQPPKPVPNGILKTPSPKVENAASRDAANPFRGEMTNGHSAKPTAEKPALPPKPPAVTNGFHAPKKLSLPRKKFVPDPEAIERITGYKYALAKPPIPPAIPAKPTPPLTRLNRAEIARKQYLDNRAHLTAANKTSSDSNKKFQQFLTQAQTDRARIVTSVPDLNAIEKAVSEKWAKERGALREVSPAKEDEDERHQRGSSRGSTPDDAWASYVQSFRKSVGGRRSQSLSYLETDVDLLVTDEEEDKWRSSSALDSGEEHPDDSDLGEELADDSGRARSEHELRIQRSLQSLPLPDWYKRSDKQKSGFILKSSAEKEKRGWAAAKSLASSTSSLASCGLRRPVRSLRSSRENIPWSRGSPDGPALSLALAKAFREPYLGWRARTSTTSSGVSSSSRTSPCGGGTDASLDGGVATTDVSFDGEDAFGRTTSSSPTGGVHPDDTGADAATVSMDTEGDSPKPPTAEDTCEDIHNMSMDTFEEVTCTLDNLSSSDTTTDTSKVKEVNPKRYSYSQSIYHSEWEDGEGSRGEDRKVKERTVQEEDEEDSSPTDHKVIWIESSFVGSRTTTSIVVQPEEQQKGNQLERPASR